ncbi:MAG: hypothetical protein HYY06_26890 [Deltaproteobacteria bacterium]|nr:hypothetical protein [Deltaproteobacteria bacterium]
MPRGSRLPSISPALLVAIVLAAPAAARAEPDPPGAGAAYSTGDTSGGSRQEDALGGRAYEAPSGFCGAGDAPPSPLDEVPDLIEEGKLRKAHSKLVSSLRRGLVPEWQRGYAFSLLAEVQLRLGLAARAVVSYRRSLDLDPEADDGSSRVGLAIALHRSGRRAAAARTAATFLVQACAPEDPVADPVVCYGAQIVSSLSAATRAERLDALVRAEALRSANEVLEESFAEYADLLPTVPRASVATQ